MFFTLVLEDKWNRFLSTFPDTHLTVPKQSKYWRNLKTLTQTNGMVWSFRLSPMCFWGQGCYTGCLIPMTGLLFFLFKHQRQWAQVTYMPVRSSAIMHVKHTHPFNGPLSGTTQVSRYHKGKTNLDFTEVRQWVAVASAGPYAHCSRQITTPAPQPLTFFTGQMPFLPPNQQCLSTEGIYAC